MRLKPAAATPQDAKIIMVNLGTNHNLGLEPLPAPHLPRNRHGLSWLAELMGTWVYEQAPFSQEDGQMLRQLSTRGSIAYIAQNQSHVSLLHLFYSLSRLNLELPHWVSGTSHLALLPLHKLLSAVDLLSRGDEQRYTINWGFWPSLNDILTYRELKMGAPVTICLNSAYQGLKEPWPYFQELVPLIKAQAQQEQPIFLVPYLFLTSIEPPKKQAGFFKKLLGNGFFDTLHDLFNFMLPERQQFSRARLATAINLQEWLQEQPKDQPLSELCNQLYIALREKFLHEERVAIGPRKPPRTAAINAILQDPKVLLAGGITDDTPLKERHQFEQKTSKIVKEISANYNGSFLRFFCYLIEIIISKLYDDVVVDAETQRLVTAAAAKGPLIICPSHKSHVDYLVASVMLLKAGLTPPHIAAGVNLSFWPLGPIFRRAGAFFIRRTFKGDKMYAAIFKSYVRYLLANGYSIEFFMEGGRSRTGKLLMPKLGMMNMILEAWRDQGYPEVHVVPLSIDYERIVEVGSYTKELAGGEKKPESIKGLLASGRLLSLNCGRIYLNFAKPINLRDFLAEQERHFPDHPNPDSYSDDDWRSINKRLAYQTLFNVGRAVTVTPTAVVSLVLLSQPGRSFTTEQLAFRVEFFLRLLYSCGVKFSPLFDQSVSASIEAVLDNLLSHGQIERESHHRIAKTPVYKLAENGAIGLDFYKNNVMQQLAPLAMVAAALIVTTSRVENRDLLPYEMVKEQVDFLSQLLKNEFLFSPTPEGMSNFDLAISFLAAHGLVNVTPDNEIKIERKEQIKWLAGTLDCFIESYWVVVSSLPLLSKFPLWQGEFSKHCLEECRFRYAKGQIMAAEAASKILINNAISWLNSAGYLTQDGSEPNPHRRTLILAKNEQEQNELASQLKAYLPQLRS